MLIIAVVIVAENTRISGGENGVMTTAVWSYSVNSSREN